MALKLLQNPVGKIRRKRHSIYDHCSKQKFLTNLEAMHIFNMSCISSSKKNPVEKNRRYDIYPCIDIASLKNFIWQTPRKKLIKRKECNMILNRLQSRGHSPLTLQIPLNLANVKVITYQSNQHFPSVKYGRDFIINLRNNHIFNLQGIYPSNVSQHMRINYFVSNITILHPHNLFASKQYM